MKEDIKSVQDDTSSFTNAKGFKIVCRNWSCQNEHGSGTNNQAVRALVFVVHGYAEHSGYYEAIGKLLASQGFHVAAYDQVGHGLSEGPRAYVTDIKEYVDDLLQYIDLVKTKMPNLPIFLMGHSMGGCVAIATMLERPEQFAGAVLIGPLVVSSPETATPAKIMAAKLLAWVAPHLGVAKIDSKWISRDPAVVKKYEDDPLNYHGKLKAGFGVALLNRLDKTINRLNELCCPLLIMHGDQDKLCEVSGSQILNSMASSKDKTLSIYEGGYHQIHHEPDGMAEQCHKENADWLVNRT